MELKDFVSRTLGEIAEGVAAGATAAAEFGAAAEIPKGQAWRAWLWIALASGVGVYAAYRGQS